MNDVWYMVLPDTDLTDPREVAVVEKRPAYPPMMLVFRGARHFELWLAAGGDNDGIWIGGSPERARVRGQQILR